MAGLGIQDAVDKATVKIGSSIAAHKSIKEQEKSTEEQKKLREQQKEANEQAEKNNAKIRELEYGLQYNQAQNDLYLNELDTANEIRKQPGKEGFRFVNTDDINEYYNKKYDDIDSKYTMAVVNRDMAMQNPKYKDKRTKSGKAFSKAEKEMDMYHQAESELIAQMALHDELVKRRNLYKAELENNKLDKYSTKLPNNQYDVINRVRKI